MSKLLPALVGVSMLGLLGAANGQPGPEVTSDQPPETYCIGCDPQPQLIDLINQERANAKVNPVALSPDLTIVAEMRSREMARKNIMEHVPLSKKEDYQRRVVNSLGFACCWENIHQGYNKKDVDRVLHDPDGWMNYVTPCPETSPCMATSPDPTGCKLHRATILNPALTHAGVGYAVSDKPSDKPYWTLILACQRQAPPCIEALMAKPPCLPAAP